MAKLPRLQSDMKLAKSVKQGLAERAGITHWAYDSMGRVITDAFTKEIGETHAEQRRAFASIQLSTATGSDLDDIGMQWAGMRRKTPTFANSAYTDLNVYFYVTAGTFGDVNNGSGIEIPRGTQLTSRPDSTGKSAIIYTVTKDYYLPSNGTVAYCSVRASSMGAGFNIAENVLRYHNVSYADSIYSTLKCNNLYPILNGQDPEDDSSFRYRISQKIPAISGNNLSNIRLQALSIPGVKRVKTIDAYFGIGTVGVIVFGADKETNQNLVERMQEKLNSIQGPGSKLLAVQGTKVHFDFDIRASLVRDLNENEKRSLERGIRRSFTNALKDQEFTGSVNIARVANRVLKDNPKISRFISGGDDVPYFEAVYARKSWSGSSGFVERRRIITNRFDLKDHEHVGLGNLDIKYELDP